MKLRIPVPVLTAAALAALLAGCSSDLPNEVGSDLATVVVDSVLVPLRVETVVDHSQLDVTDGSTTRPFVDQDVLYLGSQEGTSSAILVNFDFGDSAEVYQDTLTADMITAGNISSPRLLLNMLQFYKRLPRPDGSGAVGLRKYYDFYRLDAPFDTTATWPGAIPPHSVTQLNASPEPDDGTSFMIQIPVSADSLVSWIMDGRRIGFLIQEGAAAADVDSGMLGFSSRDNRYPASTLGDSLTVRKIGPNFRCRFDAQDYEWSMGSQADVSTFDEIAPAPPLTDRLMVRTCLRSYPALLFDLSQLPANAYINRAVLVVNNDTLSSYGNLQDLFVSEMDTTAFQAPSRELTLSDLDGAINFTTARIYSADPTYNVGFGFNVTTTIQRYVNGAYTGVRGLVLTGGEDFLGGTNAMGPGFWLSRFNFYGTAAADSLRPRLEITYSLNGAGVSEHD